MVAPRLEDCCRFIRYFEEPEPGVPTGFTGWYHSYGRFELRSAEQAFNRHGGGHTLVRPEVAGPFVAREHAVADLNSVLTAE